MQETTIKEILWFLKPHDNPFTEREEDREVLKELFRMLEKMPDFYYRLEGSYEQSRYDDDNRHPLFYIPDMVQLKRLMDAKLYTAAVHEIYDFLWFKVMKENSEICQAFLPKNIKDALMDAIESAVKE